MLASMFRVTDADERAVTALATRQHAAPAAPKTINWFLPDIDSPFYGGVNTVLRLADHLRKTNDVENRFVFWAEAERAVLPLGDRGRVPRPGAVARSCSTTRRSPRSRCCPRPMPRSPRSGRRRTPSRSSRPRTGAFYMIQDFEPMFYPRARSYALAEESYRLGLYGMCNTDHMLRLYESRYGGQGMSFEPAVDPTVFHAEGRRYERSLGEPATVFLYARPGHWRNCSELASIALEELKTRFGDRVRIVTAGSWATPEDLGSGIEHLGLLDYREMGSTSTARATSASRSTVSEHPSYLPLELMACGVPVVAFDNPAGYWAAPRQRELAAGAAHRRRPRCRHRAHRARPRAGSPPVARRVAHDCRTPRVLGQIVLGDLRVPERSRGRRAGLRFAPPARPDACREEVVRPILRAPERALTIVAVMVLTVLAAAPVAAQSGDPDPTTTTGAPTTTTPDATTTTTTTPPPTTPPPTTVAPGTTVPDTTTSTTTTTTTPTTVAPTTLPDVGAGGVGAASLPSGVATQVFTQGLDGALWWRQLSNGGWSAWQSFGGGIQGAPTAAVGLNGWIYVFVRGTDNALWWQGYFNGSWTGWKSLGGSLTSAPVAYADASGITVFVRSSDNALWYGRIDAGGWRGWRSAGGSILSSPAVSGNGTGMYVFVTGGDGGVWVNRFSSGTPTSWISLGGVPSLDLAAAADDSGVTVYVRGSVNALYRRRLSGSVFLPWESLGGNISSSPAVVGGGAASSLFARGLDGALYVQKITGGVPNGWQSLGGAVTADPTATVDATGTTVLVRGNDFQLWGERNEGTWPGWSGLGGVPMSTEPFAVSTPVVTAAPPPPPTGRGFDACEAPSIVADGGMAVGVAVHERRGSTSEVRTARARTMHSTRAPGSTRWSHRDGASSRSTSACRHRASASARTRSAATCRPPACRVW